MPAIRDWTYNYTTTTVTSVTGFLPWTEQNDLMLAIVTGDSATTTTYSASGWTSLFNTTSSSSLGILWKIAGASESNPTFTSSVSTTLNCHLLSIRDVNTTTPFNGTGGAGTGYRTQSATNIRAAMPVLTTTVNNSLILYINTTAQLTVPTVIEGPCTFEDGADGQNHSEGFSWGFKEIAGAVGSDVFHQKLGTASAGIQATIGISPPASGATLIPAYCVSDASEYIEPLNGTTSYRDNLTAASNGQSFFGTAISTATGVNSSVSAAADVGLNSYNSMTQLTGSNNTNQYSGMTVRLNTTNAVGNVLTKNIIAHCRPATPRSLQNTDAISRPGAKGIMFGLSHRAFLGTVTATSGSTSINITAVTYGAIEIGMVLNATGMVAGQRIVSFGTGSGGTGTYNISASTTAAPTNASVTGYTSTMWHVHGANTPWNSSAHIPIVVNSRNTTGVLQTRGTWSGNLTAIHFAVSGFAVAPVWQFGTVWVLDTTVIAGGNSTFPVDLRQIYKIAGQGKNRLSVMQQGSGQILCMQPIQFGNGGVDNIYLNLDGTTIEFPRQYSVQAEQVFYCSADNAVGLTYYAGSGDTVIHTNAVVTSNSRYFWGFHPSSASSSAATYNFSGLLVSGAGIVTLKSDIDISDLTFNNCGNIEAAGSTLTEVHFKSTAQPNGYAFNISGSTQSALQSALNKLVDCFFELNTLSRGALKITYTGSESLVTLSISDLKFSSNSIDIWWDAPVGRALLWKNTTPIANATTSTTFPNTNTVTIEKRRTFVIQNIISGSTVYIYRTSDDSLLAGAAVVSASPSGLTNATVEVDVDNPGKFKLIYEFTYGVSNIDVYITAISVGYQALRPTYVLANENSTLQINQLIDRQYDNPV